MASHTIQLLHILFCTSSNAPNWAASQTHPEWISLHSSQFQLTIFIHIISTMVKLLPLKVDFDKNPLESLRWHRVIPLVNLYPVRYGFLEGTQIFHIVKASMSMWFKQSEGGSDPICICCTLPCMKMVTGCQINIHPRKSLWNPTIGGL